MRRAIAFLIPLVGFLLASTQTLQGGWKPLTAEEIEQIREERHTFYAAESRGLDDAIHEYYLSRGSRSDGNQTDFDVRYYGLHLNLHFDTQTIDAFVEYRIRSVISGLASVTLNLRTELTVDSVKMGGASATYSHLDHLLIIALPTAVGQDQEFGLVVYYHGTPYYDGAAGLRFSSQMGQQLCWTKATPFRSRYWWPCKDYPEDKPDSIDMYMEMPSTYDLITNGVQISSAPVGADRKLVHYKHNYPITTFCVAFCCTQYTIHQQTWSYEGNAMPLYSYSLPGNGEALDSFRVIGPHVLTTLSDLYGVYPFVDEKMANADFGWTGAMEHQTACMYATNFHSGWIIAHESAHQWWGDMISCRTFNHIWLSEGFASYSEALYYETLYGAKAYHDYVLTQKYLGEGSIYVENLTYEEIYNGNLSYDKASWVLHMLRGVLRDSLFFKAVRDWGNSQFRFGTATTEDFISVLSASVGRDMSWFVSEWIYGNANPNYEISWLCSPDTGRGGYDLTYSIEQLQTSGTIFKMPIRTRFVTTGTAADTVLWNEDQLTFYSLWLPDSVTSVVCDEEQWILRSVAAVPFRMRIRTIVLPDGEQGMAYSQSLTAVGGKPPYHWRFYSGDLPYGLDFDSTTATVSGIPNYPATFYFTIGVTDNGVPAASDLRGYALKIGKTLHICGDANTNTSIDITDAVYLIAYIFSGGPAPDPISNGDSNCDGAVNVADAVYLIAYIFSGGPPPCANCS